MRSPHAPLALASALALALVLAAVAGSVAGCAASQTQGQTPAANTTGAGSGGSGGAAGSAASGPSGSSTGDAELGRQIFATGSGADGAPITATSGAGGACSRCHGDDAAGKIGPDIRWPVLTGAVTSDRSPRFVLSSEGQFKAAVTSGVVSGNQLRQMMPHYQLTDDQVSGLVAYLKSVS